MIGRRDRLSTLTSSTARRGRVVGAHRGSSREIKSFLKASNNLATSSTCVSLQLCGSMLPNLKGRHEVSLISLGHRKARPEKVEVVCLCVRVRWVDCG